MTQNPGVLGSGFGMPPAGGMFGQDFSNSAAYGNFGAYSGPNPGSMNFTGPGPLGAFQQPMSGGPNGMGWAGGGFAGNFGMGQGGYMGAGIPSEAEVMETYASFGAQLQQSTMALVNLLERQILEPFLLELDESDRIWQSALATRGMRLSYDPPRHQYPGLAGPPQELSIFQQELPAMLRDDQRAPILWSQRQRLESYLCHPSFEPSQRQHVMQRIREFRQRGLTNVLTHHWRPGDMMPSDGHILENLLIKMLNVHMDFSAGFVTTSNAPPYAKQFGAMPSVYLRQVADQAVHPKPPPHYEVCTPTKVWKLRPGNTHLFEAMALLMHILKQQNPRCFQAFPPPFQAICGPQGGLFNITNRLLPWLFGR